MRAQELECPVIFAVENQFLFLSDTFTMKIIIEFSCASKVTFGFSLVLDKNNNELFISVLEKGWN